MPRKRRVTTAQLHRAEQAYREADAEREKARAKRNAVVRAAAEEGWSYEEIGAALGLSRSRAGQIAAQGGAKPRRAGRRREVE